MAGWHHQSNGHELGQILGDGEGKRGLVCCSPWGRKESGTTGQQTAMIIKLFHITNDLNSSPTCLFTGSNE